ncbi:hypothetical protein [Microseira wollei]|uniref:hypothetical protein n=1 Tax=Microseira wollei TaxID=467598 RepID=UPI001CFEA5C0|nr:hypothetical protein [Microseira wollei]
MPDIAFHSGVAARQHQVIGRGRQDIKMPCPYTLPDLPHLLHPRAEILKKTIA